MSAQYTGNSYYMLQVVLLIYLQRPLGAYKPLIMQSTMEKVNNATYLAWHSKLVFLDFLLHIYNKCNKHVTILNVTCS